jgi:putative hydrolase of the HAD superfamily
VRIEHVLLDADGVLQDMPGGWDEAVTPYVGERAREFLLRAWEDEIPSLAGAGDFLPVLEALLADFDVPTPAAQFHEEVWLRIEVAPESMGLVRDLKRAGYGVHLATNQAAGRAAHMRSVLGYDDLFDVSLYSCELGVAKPDPAFFREAARLIDAPPEAILFVDDSDRNVAGAREAGLVAEQWDLGADRTLGEILAAHGVQP